MKIALLGYGRMGKEIEKIALSRKHEIVLKIDIDNQQDLNTTNLNKADVAIDFSVPTSAYDNIMKCFEAGTPVVSGTTGWMNKFTEVTDYCRENQKTFFYAPNYSIGVNIFFEINRLLAGMMDRFAEYDVNMEETHHIHKLDAPSGTAISLAEGILENIRRKTKWESGRTDKENLLGIESVREGEVPGVHKVRYESEVDSIEMVHTSKSRKGLAQGAVLAAEFIAGKTGIFTMKDLMSE
jgi:4-hydroxy-tetrahydrodipicolinate reductase